MSLSLPPTVFCRSEVAEEQRTANCLINGAGSDGRRNTI